MQLALIVDDSKTARLLLQKMLAKLDISSALVESGEEALDYLRDSHPDVIFMDHMMPGMDGFATVKAIKADTEKATIPIVMHTTKQGDIYLGQARALGAVDILTKPASSKELQRVLDQVETSSDTQPPEDPVIPLSKPSAPSTANSMTMEMPALNYSPAGDNPPFFGTARQWLLVLVWLAPTFWLLSLYLEDQDEIKALKQQRDNTFAAIEVLMNQQQTYDYGEVPMGGGRLALLQAVLPLLEKSGFRGELRIEGHIGDFCLSQIPLADGSEVMMLPPPELPLTACDIIGVSAVRAMRQSIAESPEFAALREQYSGQASQVRIELAAYGATTPQYSYPANLEGMTTGDLNAVALDNNLVNYVLIPD